MVIRHYSGALIFSSSAAAFLLKSLQSSLIPILYKLSWWLQKEMSPPVVKASRRLLINAVREVVNESALLATKKDALRRNESAKRLQSVVSSDAGKTPSTH